MMLIDQVIESAEEQGEIDMVSKLKNLKMYLKEDTEDEIIDVARRIYKSDPKFFVWLDDELTDIALMNRSEMDIDKENTRDFDNYLERYESAVDYLSLHGVPEETIRTDIDEAIEKGEELDDVVERLDDEYKMSPDADTVMERIDDTVGQYIPIKERDRDPDAPEIPDLPYFRRRKIIATIVSDLIKLADALDKKGFHSDADQIDNLLNKLS